MESEKLELENIPAELRPYFEAKEKGALREYFLDSFKHWKNDYKDDLPDVDIRTLVTLDDRGHFVGDNYKCRGNYIWGLSGTFSTAITDGVITDSKLLEKIKNFQQHDFRYLHNEFTTQQEIDMINQILADVIQYLEKK